MDLNKRVYTLSQGKIHAVEIMIGIMALIILAILIFIGVKIRKCMKPKPADPAASVR